MGVAGTALMAKVCSKKRNSKLNLQRIGIFAGAREKFHPPPLQLSISYVLCRVSPGACTYFVSNINRRLSARKGAR